MDAKTKRQIAREWLILVGACAVGGSVLPAIIMLLGAAHELRLGAFYSALYSNSSGDQAVAWVVFFGPYLLIQLGRSVIWAYKTIRDKQEPTQ